MHKGFTDLNLNLFECFKAVGQKPWAHHVNLSDPLLGKLLQGRLGIGLKPFGGAKTALKSHLIRIIGQTQILRQGTRRFVAIAAIGVTEINALPGQAVKTHHQLLRLAVLLPKSCNLVAQRADKGGIGMKTLNKTKRRLIAHMTGDPSHFIHHSRSRA